MGQPVRFVWQTDEQGRFTVASEAFVRLVGDPTAALLGRPWREIAEKLRLDPNGQIAQAMATRDTWSGVTLSWPIGTSDTCLAVELSALPIFDRERTFRGYRGFGLCRDVVTPAIERDLTQRNSNGGRATLLAPQMEQEHAAAEAVSSSIVRFGSGTKAVEAVAPSLTPAEHEAFREISRKLGQGLGAGSDANGWHGELRAEQGAAATVKHHSNDSAWRDKPPERATDIRSILDRMPAGILVYRLNQLLYANPNFLRWSGHETLDALNEAGGLDELFIEPLAAVHSGADQTFTLSLDCGDSIPLRCELVNIPWDGEPADALVACSTGTPKPVAVEHLLEAKHQAEAASSLKSEFVAKISHELRTPLNSLIGFAELLLQERFGPLGNERYREYLKHIHDSGTHLLSLVNDLLDLSKIESGKIELTFAPLDLNDLVAQCVALMQPQAQRVRVIMRSSPGPGMLPISADARSLRQMMFNLLSNSLKFTPAGGQVIVSTALNETRQAVLRVRDTGTGMSVKEVQAALDPARPWSSMPATNGGTGLGLPLTKALAEANRARFCLTSTPSAGTLVEIAFPTEPFSG